MYSNTFRWHKRLWITVILHIKILLTVRKINTKSMFLNHICNLMNNCKSLVNDSNDGTSQLAVLWFWTFYNVWYSEQNVLEKLDLFRYTGKKWWEGTHWFRPLNCDNPNHWTGPSDDVRELFDCSKTTCDLRYDLAVMQIRQIIYYLTQNKQLCDRTTETNTFVSRLVTGILFFRQHMNCDT